ncbi:hypothetical protein [Stenoxybacter acetivorans]|uniref:hypothetical protein n=1 Tax=Stenoxybacter acetivorans TaxID=422441 RepID=UPI000561E0B3|nr:hypothetical protein [Stenoxybacter acetivorans]
MYFVDRSAVVLKPTAAFLQWLKSTDDNIPELTLTQLQSNCTTLLIPECDRPESAIAYIGERYQAIFEAEIAAWELPESQWPRDMSLTAFWQFFEAEIHDMVLDTMDADIHVSPVSNNMM